MAAIGDLIDNLEKRLAEVEANAANMRTHADDALGFDAVALADQIDRNVEHARYVIGLFRDGRVDVGLIESYGRCYGVV